jgi:hypothetical protein
VGDGFPPGERQSLLLHIAPLRKVSPPHSLARSARSQLERCYRLRSRINLLLWIPERAANYRLAYFQLAQFDLGLLIASLLDAPPPRRLTQRLLPPLPFKRCEIIEALVCLARTPWAFMEGNWDEDAPHADKARYALSQVLSGGKLDPWDYISQVRYAAIYDLFYQPQEAFHQEYDRLKRK